MQALLQGSEARAPACSADAWADIRTLRELLLQMRPVAGVQAKMAAIEVRARALQRRRPWRAARALTPSRVDGLTARGPALAAASWAGASRGLRKAAALPRSVRRCRPRRGRSRWWTKRKAILEQIRNLSAATPSEHDTGIEVVRKLIPAEVGSGCTPSAWRMGWLQDRWAIEFVEQRPGTCVRVLQGVGGLRRRAGSILDVR